MPLQNTIIIKKSNVFSKNGTSFIPLTDQDTFAGLFQKLTNNTEDSTKFWATLGRQDNVDLMKDWSGKIVCSKEGNNSFTTRGLQIRQEAQNLQNMFPDLNPPDLTTVYEKFLSLDDLNFGTDPNAGKLRLTINLKKDEQAVTFLQITDTSDVNSENGIFSYILPDKYEEKTNVNKLTYNFEVPAQSSEGKSRTLIKVITYKNKPLAKLSLAEAGSLAKKYDTPYCINLYSPATNQFVRLKDTDIATKIDPKKKTLLMIHGTFASVMKSYGDLIDNGWLSAVAAKGKYQQIIGFDHYTVVESPQQNADALFKMLQPVGAFTQTVDIITSSRGGLVGKSIINDKKQTIFKVERAATVACANGVQWMTTGENIGKMLGFMRLTDREPDSKLLLTLAQSSVQNFLAQPGLEVMNKTSPNLKSILDATPANPGMRYYPVCGDYLTTGNHPAGWKFFDRLLNAALKNKHHDWVVETDYQVIMPSGFLAYGKPVSFFRNQTIDTTHTRYFYDPMSKIAKQRIFDYLHDTNSVL